jgi:ribosomal protein L7Ae-like RNA K-turn-binding protein
VVVVVCTDVRPSQLISHLQILSHVRAIPIAALAAPSSTLGIAFGLETVLCFALEVRLLLLLSVCDRSIGDTCVTGSPVPFEWG